MRMNKGISFRNGKSGRQTSDIDQQIDTKTVGKPKTEKAFKLIAFILGVGGIYLYVQKRL